VVHAAAVAVHVAAAVAVHAAAVAAANTSNRAQRA
jgi:hypothetical protein